FVCSPECSDIGILIDLGIENVALIYADHSAYGDESLSAEYLIVGIGRRIRPRLHGAAVKSVRDIDCGHAVFDGTEIYTRNDAHADIAVVTFGSGDDCLCVVISRRRR